MLRTKNLTKVYKSKKGAEVKALKDVSVDFGDSGLVFLLGKSGSGKSTLMNLLGGIDKATSGEIVINGRSSSSFKECDYDSYRNTYVGFVFQDYNLIDNYTVGANISLALELQGKAVDSAIVNEMLKKVELVDEKGETLYNRQTNELSGGQKQRVAIARALIKSPQIILADEPTGALDSETGEQLYDLLKNLSKDKLVIVVTHDRENAEKYGDRVIELKDGKIVSDSVAVTETAKSEVKVGSENMAVDSENSTTQPKFVEGKLPFKRCFSMGASGLTVKRFRLTISMLLSIISFIIFGFSITAALTDENTTIVKHMYDTKHSMMVIESETVEPMKKYNIGNSGSYSLSNIPRPFCEEQLEILKKYNNNTDIMWVSSPDDGVFDNPSAKYDLRYVDRFYTERPSGYYYNFGFSYTVCELDPNLGLEQANLKPDSRFLNKSLSRLPQDFTEIAITDLMADLFMKLDYKDDVGAKLEIKTPDDLMGKKVNDFTIVGVYSTEIDRAEIEKLILTETKFDDEYIETVVWGLRESMLSLSFVKKGFLSSLNSEFMPFGVTVKLSGDLTKDSNLLRDLKYTKGGFERDIDVKFMYSQFVSLAMGNNYMIIPVGLVFSAIFTVFAILLTMFFLNVSFDFKKKEIGVLRALGARKKDITLVCLIEIGLIAVINFIVSLISINVICAVFNYLNHAPVYIFGILPFFLLFLLCFGVAALATIIPVRRIVNKKPIDIINNK